MTEDAKLIVVAFGIAARIAKGAIKQRTGKRPEGGDVQADHPLALSLGESSRIGQDTRNISLSLK